MTQRHVVVIGAGVGGLSAAIELAAAGHRVTVFEAAPVPGGKMRQVEVAGAGVDAGPTVFTMRWIFEALFAAAHTSLEAELELVSADILARHAWSGGGRLDLFADIDRSAAAIEAFAGSADADGYRRFCERSARIYRTLRDTFIANSRPNPLSLMSRVGFSHLGDLWNTAPFQSMWSALGTYFRDERLRQLFGRYATYVGSSPLQTPATLMLIAHVEQDGVWQLRGGMLALAKALESVARRLGVTFHFDSPVDEIILDRERARGVRCGSERYDGDAFVFNGDVSALGHGLLGDAVRRAAQPVPPGRRALSAVTWCVQAEAEGFPLDYHNVFFAEDYPREFEAIFGSGTVRDRPTVYLCAQDRLGHKVAYGPERMLLLINAPANGDREPYDEAVQLALLERTLKLLEECGLRLHLDPTALRCTTPAGFNTLFPGSGGSLYGRASHGMMASFARPGARTTVPGLFLAGGSTHPGAGVPMAAMSGRLAAAEITGRPLRTTP